MRTHPARTALALLSLCVALPACAQSRPGRELAQADRLLQRLSTREKAGQLFMLWSLSSADAAARAELRQKVDAADLGGVILSLGSAAEAASLIEELQRDRAIPLLIAGDFEAGVGFRLTGTSDFGNNMLIGATGLSRLSFGAGAATGTEAKALGFHWCFAPVADVNSNPANPIINVRSFGEDPALVAKFAAEFIRGVESVGVLATAKHFPGHGDVASDSHLTMPTVPGSRERLESVELPPFEAAIAAGVSSIMTGHLAVPGLDEDPAIPATLSRRILTGLLRERMGFDGLIVTDALDMGGVREKIPPTTAAVRALAAGADVLLMPPDAVAARDAVIAAVESGEVSKEILDAAVRRVLTAKARTVMAEDRGARRPTSDWREHVATRAHVLLADEIAVRGLTLVRDRDGLVPLRARAPETAAESRVFVVLSDKDDPRGAGIGAGLAEKGFTTFHLHPKSDAGSVAAVAAAVQNADLAVGAFAIKVRSYSGTIGIPPVMKPVVDALRTHGRAIAVSLGNPYLIRDFSEVSTYLCAYAATPATERAVVAALLGEAPITGRIPVRIPDISAAGAGLTVLPAVAAASELESVAPSSEGLRDDLPMLLRGFADKWIAERAFPGASICVTRRGRIVAEVAVGRETYADDAAVITPKTRYDLASLSKVCATTPAVLRAIAAGELALDTKVTSLVPEFQGGDKREVTVLHLLTHTAGLPAYVKFFETMQGKQQIVTAAAETPLKRAPGAGYEYSDLGLILLMACVERATGEDFEAFVQREVFDPLGMQSAGYAHSGQPIDAPATEDDGFRGRVVRGEVHDENAFAMGGVSGHAGVFATARDVAKLGNAFLGGGRGWLPAPLARAAITRAEVVAGSSRALGWDTFVAGQSGGSKLSARAFGHTGFTGTSVWCDPATDLCIVMLSNRVHPTRDNPKIAAARRELADLVVDSML